MARIRSLKIGFFKNEDLSALPFGHRLCFEGLWLLADREGRLEDRPRRIKAELFPYDDVNVDEMLAALHGAGFIVRYTVDGHGFIQVLHFLKHQRPKSDEAASVIPAMVLEIPRGKDAGPRISELGKDRETEDRETERQGDSAAAPDTLASFWNALTSAPIPRCREVSDKRRKQIRSRLTERSMDEWTQVIERIQASTFCRGFNDRGWIASFDWLIGSPDVAVKVLEGKYDDRRKMPRPEPPRSYQPSAHADYDTWREVCHELHGGECGNYQAHQFRLMKEQQVAS